MKTFRQFINEEKWDLMGTSRSLKEMEKLLKDFFHEGSFVFKKISDSPEVYVVVKDGKELPDGRIIKISGRYRFEIERK